MSEICACIAGPTLEDVYSQLSKAADADLLEWRLDLWDEAAIAGLCELHAGRTKRVILTLRTSAEGGAFNGDYDSELQGLLALSPDILDVESWYGLSDLGKIDVTTQFLLSTHLAAAPQNPGAQLSRLAASGADYIKLAYPVTSTLQGLEALQAAQSFNERVPKALVVAMGTAGELTRIAAGRASMPWIYACLDEGGAVAPGQLTVRTLRSLYRAHLIGPESHLYGLIGDPVSGSIGHDCHNAVLAELGRNALYLKCALAVDELEAFLDLAPALGFRGFSVTMPLKERAAQLIAGRSELVEEISALNTLSWRGSTWWGESTDGAGALRAIRAALSLDSPRVLLLGAGGAARAIAYAIKGAGWSLCVTNRGHERASRLAAEVGAEHVSWERRGAVEFDLLIHATPMQESPLSASCLRPEHIVMETSTRPQRTGLTQLAEQVGCQIIYGVEMFIEQGLEQCALWYSLQDLSAIRTCIKESAYAVLARPSE